MNLPPAAYADPVQCNILTGNHFHILQNLLKLFDSCLNIALLILGCIVFGVLGQVSLLHCFLNLLGNFLSPLHLQAVKLIRILLKTRIR